MSITLVNFLPKVLPDDNISGTTTSDGATNKKSFVDSALAKYCDGYFGDPERDPAWWAYIATELRSIETSQGANGTVAVHSAFSSQVTSGTAYSIHRFDRDKQIVAINQALNDAYPWFYQRVEDETTLDGTGGSDNEYEVPATFSEFPDQIWKKHTVGTVITYTQITDYVAKEVGGTRYFYADITLDDDILLVGKTYLSQFTSDASTTELSSGQADVVALLAASIFYRNLSGTVNASDSGRFDSLASRYGGMYEARKIEASMPKLTAGKLDWSWLE